MSSDIIQPLLKKRIGDNKVDRTIDDVLNIFSATDEVGARGLLPVFCAASLTRAPTVPHDLSELAAINLDLATSKQQMNTLIISMAHSSAHPNELAASVQTSSTEIIMRDDSSGTMPGETSQKPSETIQPHTQRQ